MEENSSNAGEADRLLRISEKLLQGRDFSGSRDFAILAQEADPFLDGTDQILAVADVLIASEKRIGHHRDWYAVLQFDRRSGDDADLVKRQYRRLALLLHPDKNKFPFADAAFRLVADAWTVHSDPRRKSAYDNELRIFDKVNVVGGFQQQKLPVRRGGGYGGGNGNGGVEEEEEEEEEASSFWTVCPYCYNLYEYARVYEDCCLRCQNCGRAFHGVTIPTLPPLVAGKEAYHCCWSFFPVPSAIAAANSHGGAKKAAVTVTAADRQSQPPRSVYSNSGAGGRVHGFVDFSMGIENQGQKKRGRPRKNVQPW